MDRIVATEHEWKHALKLLEAGQIEADVELHAAEQEEGQDLNLGCVVIEI